MNSSFLLFDLVHTVPMENPSGLNQVFEVPALTFDRVCGGYIVTSPFPLFRMPVELFSHVTGYLSKDDLKALAEVDRDCSRLAALSLFKDLKIDTRSDQPQSLVSLPPLSIRPCIRHLTMLVPTILDRKTTDCQLLHIGRLVAFSLPNLHILEWEGHLSVHILQFIQSSPIKNLRLKGGVLSSDVDHHCPDSSEFPVDTLSLEVSLLIHDSQRAFFNNLFKCVAPTLRHLAWKREDDIRIDQDLEPFPNLHSLIFDVMKSDYKADSIHILHHFLGERTKVQYLSMDSATDATRNFLNSRGHVRSLKHFCWINHDWAEPSYIHFLAFLDKNPQLETVHIAYPTSEVFIETSLLPLLQCHFDLLTSLHLVWSAPNIPEESLRKIASISTLQRLWISAGNQGIRNTWEIDHETILKHFSPLRCLETLAFSYDTYVTNAHPLAPRFCDYYAMKAFPINVDISKYLTPAELLIYQGKTSSYDLAIFQQISMRRMAWEKWHAERMARVARNYARTFRGLRWCFIGQLVFATGGASLLSTIEDPPRREPCLSSLRKRMSMTLWRPL